ncbi:MAG: DUF2299 family protein [Methanobrevibacter sp.]|jgi:hypothetical protein|nr:DUF2299 family protein [Candidatus Methanoflexus mossambicus]
MITEQTIQNWLVEEGLFKEKIHDENANYHFIVNYPEDNVIDLLQVKGKEDSIILGCGTMVDPQQQELIKALPQAKQEKLIWDFKSAINKFLMDFQLEHPNNILHLFVITDQIFFDGLNKHSLISTIKKIFKVKLQCLLILEKYLGIVHQNPNNVPQDNAMFG